MILLNFQWCQIPILLLFMQVDCPEDVASYIHRVGRTARYHSGGRSVLFIMPSEMKMLERLESAKVPIQLIKVNIFFFLSFSSPFPIPLVLSSIINLLLFYEQLCIQSLYQNCFKYIKGDSFYFYPLLSNFSIILLIIFFIILKCPLKFG